MSSVLVIGDTHFPAVHPDYLDFVLDTKKKYKCTKIMHIGDVVDHHTISFHKKHPEHTGAMQEYEQAMKFIDTWKKLFPKMSVCIGNHDERVFRLAADAGIPPFYIKEYKKIYNTPGWDWAKDFFIDNVYYTHGTGASSQYPAFNTAKARATSCVMGHHHSVAGINWLVGPTTRYFGMDVGSGVDRTHIAMQYGSTYIKKPVVSCGAVVDGHPYLELMSL